MLANAARIEHLQGARNGFYGAMFLRRLMLVFYIALFGCVAGVSGTFFWRAHKEYARLREVQAANQRKLAQAELKLQQQEETLRRLRTDPEYVKQVIRRRLGYAKPDEYIFSFDR